MDVKKKIKELNIDEKLTLLTGSGALSAIGLPKQGLQGVNMADGPYGVKTEDGDSVCFMNTCLMASSWDRELCHAYGELLGGEVTRCGKELLLVPAINIKRSPLAGRNFEYYSEDPYLTGMLAANYVNGLKSQGALTCVKHFACNNQEALRWTQNSVVDDDTLRNIYLKAFEIVVKNTSVDCVMAAYNVVNGVYACQNEYLLTDILRGEWGFDGVVMSDWCAVADLVASVNAGLDLEMPGNYANSFPKLKKAYESGALTKERIDEAVARILALYDKKPQTRVGEPINVDVEKLVQMTGESFVLLKNEGVLPFEREEKILLVGTAKNPRIQGGGCAKLKTKFLTLPYDEIAKKASVCDNIDGYDVTGWEEKLPEYDKIVVFLTLPADCDSEAFDRTQLNFPKEQTDVISALKKYNENIVAVLQNGSAVETSFDRGVKGLLETYYAGSYGAVALANVLYGRITPSGKLAESFPVAYADVPCKNQFGYKTDVVYEEREFVGYRYYTSFGVTPKYPFGYGLSYCDFEWSDMRVERKGAYSFELRMTVKNRSEKYDGKETVQIYLESESKFEPKRELISFENIKLSKGERKEIVIQLDKSAFERYRGGKKVTVDGNYAICFARDSESVAYRETFPFAREVRLELNEQTLVGSLLGNPLYREKTLEYMQKAINLWAYGEAETEYDFEDEIFLKSSVYNMPLRAFPYVDPEVFDDGKMNRLIDELKRINNDLSKEDKQ